jgi:hypothetical protein
VAKKVFVYTANQRYLHNINLRIGGLTTDINLGKPYEGELVRMQAAWADVRSKMTDEEFNELEAHDNRVLTPAEIAAEAKETAARMAENRDKVSI